MRSPNAAPQRSKRGSSSLQSCRGSWRRTQYSSDNYAPSLRLGSNTSWIGGEGVQQDYETAVKWDTLADEQGNATVKFNLGTMYDNGDGVPKDYVYAHMWFNIAASSGNKGASENRDIVAERMTPSQIQEAQTLARECVAKNYKGC
jgi:TPR repeat protein